MNNRLKNKKIWLLLLIMVKGLCMESSLSAKKDFSIFKARRKELVDLIKQEHGAVQGAVLLFAGFERPAGNSSFAQDSSFFYLTGIMEPGLALLLNFNGQTTLFVPQFNAKITSLSSLLTTRPIKALIVKSSGPTPSNGQITPPNT